MPDSPFDSIDNAHEYVRMLALEVASVKQDLSTDLAIAERDRAERRVEALKVADYKLQQLSEHLRESRRLLSDLRVLRRLLVGQDDGAVYPEAAELLNRHSS